MRRHEFDHVISAAAEVREEREIVVIGSQAILGKRRGASAEHARLDGGGCLSPLGPEAVVGPAGWQERLVRIEIPPA